MEMGFPCDGLIAVEKQPRLSYVLESTNPDHDYDGFPSSPVTPS